MEWAGTLQRIAHTKIKSGLCDKINCEREESLYNC